MVFFQSIGYNPADGLDISFVGTQRASISVRILLGLLCLLGHEESAYGNLGRTKLYTELLPDRKILMTRTG